MHIDWDDQACVASFGNTFHDANHSNLIADIDFKQHH